MVAATRTNGNYREEDLPLPNGLVYSQKEGLTPFSVPPLEKYTPILGEDKIERLLKAAEKLKGCILDCSSPSLDEIFIARIKADTLH